MKAKKNVLKPVFSERRIIRPASPGGPGIGVSCEAFYCSGLGLLVVDLVPYDSTEQTPDDDLPSSVRKVISKVHRESDAIRSAVSFADAYGVEVIKHIHRN